MVLLPGCACCGGDSCDLAETAAEYAAKVCTIEISENTVARDAATSILAFQWSYTLSETGTPVRWVDMASFTLRTFDYFPERPNPTATCHEPGDRVSGSHSLDYNAALSVATTSGRNVVFRKTGPSYQITATLELSTSPVAGFENVTFSLDGGCSARLRVAVVAWNYESRHTASEIGLSPQSQDAIQSISAPPCDAFFIRQTYRVASYHYASVPYLLYINPATASSAGGNYSAWFPGGVIIYDGTGYFDTSLRPSGAVRSRGENYFSTGFYLPTVNGSGAISGSVSGTYTLQKWITEAPAAGATSALASGVSISVGETHPAASPTDNACDLQIPRSAHTTTNYTLKRTTPALALSAAVVFA